MAGNSVHKPMGEVLKPVTVIGLVWTDKPEPMLSWCHSYMPPETRDEATLEARTTLMQAVADRERVSVAELEVHDVLVMPGHLSQVAFEREPRRRRR